MPGDDPDRKQAEADFYNLFWGKLALVEDKKVEAKMVAFRSALNSGADQLALQQQSLDLAHALRDSLAVSWKVGDWKSHYGKQEVD